MPSSKKGQVCPLRIEFARAYDHSMHRGLGCQPEARGRAQCVDGLG